MVPIRRNWKHIASLVALVGICQFVLCAAVAIYLYPGGNPFDPEREGYAFWSNSLSDLGRDVSYTGVPNPVGSAVFNTSLGVATLAVGIGLKVAVRVHGWVPLKGRAPYGES